MNVVIIGLGAIGRMIVDGVAGDESPVRLAGVLAPNRAFTGLRIPPECSASSDLVVQQA